MPLLKRKESETFTFEPRRTWRSWNVLQRGLIDEWTYETPDDVRGAQKKSGFADAGIHCGGAFHAVDWESGVLKVRFIHGKVTARRISALTLLTGQIRRPCRAQGGKQTTDFLLLSFQCFYWHVNAKYVGNGHGNSLVFTHALHLITAVLGLLIGQAASGYKPRSTLARLELNNRKILIFIKPCKFLDQILWRAPETLAVHQLVQSSGYYIMIWQQKARRRKQRCNTEEVHTYLYEKVIQPRACEHENPITQ